MRDDIERKGVGKYFVARHLPCCRVPYDAVLFLSIHELLCGVCMAWENDKHYSNIG